MTRFNKTEVWVENRLDDLLESIQEIVSKNQRPASEVILDDSDVMQLLKICKRSLASFRAEGLIVFYKVKGKIYYKLSDIIDMLDNNKVSIAIAKPRLFKNK